jgi:predicted GNAT family acetyltransferase
MKDEFLNIPLSKDDAVRHFEMTVRGQKAFIVYRETDAVVTLVHTQVAPGLQGHGAATALIEKTLDYIERNHLKMTPLCPMVLAYLKRHPEWKRLVATGTESL